MESDGQRRDEYEARAGRLGIPFVDLHVYKPDAASLQCLSGALARAHQVLPVKRQNEVIFVAVGNLVAPETLDALFVSQGCYVRQVLVVPEVLEWAIQRYYPSDQATGA